MNGPVRTDPRQRTSDDAGLIAASMTRPERFAELFDRHFAEIHRYVDRRLGAALARLSRGDRDVLLLVALGDLTYEEVSEALGVAYGTVCSRLSRARRRLRAALGDDDPLVLEDRPGWRNNEGHPRREGRFGTEGGGFHE